MSPYDFLFSELESIKLELSSLTTRLTEKDERLKLYQEEVDRLHEIIRELKRQTYGPRSERWESEDQLVFNEAEMLAQNEKPESEDEAAPTEDIKVEAHTKKRGKRKPLPDNLPREVVVLEPPESERVDENGNPLKIIGEEISEKLVYEPSVMKVVEYHRPRYGVECGDTGVIAPPPPSIIPKGIPTASLLAFIATQKFCYGLPFYRIEEMFKRMGVEIPRCTQARWIIQAAEACAAIKNVLNDRLMLAPYVSCDETWTQVLKEKGKTAESQSWMWVRATPAETKKIVLFDYDPSRSAEVAKRLFADYKGILQADGYAGYNPLEEQDGVTRIGCNMHGRRKFESARTNGAKTGKTLAEEALKFYQDLYKIEEDARSLTFDERHRLRQKAIPIWADFKAWAETNAKKVPPKSKIGEAFRYFLNEYEYLIGYLRDGQLEMDNGFAERAIKNFAIGRKNWLFSDTEAGAEASSFFYSIVVTAKLNGNDTYQILKMIFERIPLAKTLDDIELICDLILTSPTHA